MTCSPLSHNIVIPILTWTLTWNFIAGFQAIFPSPHSSYQTVLGTILSSKQISVTLFSSQVPWCLLSVYRVNTSSPFQMQPHLYSQPGVHFPCRHTPANTKLTCLWSLSYHSIFFPNLYLNPSHLSRPISHVHSNLEHVTFIIPRPHEIFHAPEKGLHLIFLVTQWGLVHFVIWEARPPSRNIWSFSRGSYLHSIFFSWMIWWGGTKSTLVQRQSWILGLPKQFC